MVVVLAGVHIQEQTQQPKLDHMDCPTKGAVLDFSQATDDNFSCPMSGSNLQNLSSVRLKNAESSNDKTTIDGKASPANGKTDSGTVTFSLPGLKSLVGARYSAFEEAANGAEYSTNITVTLPPTISKFTPSSLQLGSCDTTKDTCHLDLTGNHLDLAAKMSLVPSSGTGGVTSSGFTAADPASASVDFKLSELKALVTQSTDLQVALVLKDGTNLPTAQKLTVAPPPQH